MNRICTKLSHIILTDKADMLTIIGIMLWNTIQAYTMYNNIVQIQYNMECKLPRKSYIKCQTILKIDIDIIHITLGHKQL